MVLKHGKCNRIHLERIYDFLMKAIFILGSKAIFILGRVLSQGYEQEINLRQSALGHQRAETRDQSPLCTVVNCTVCICTLVTCTMYLFSVGSGVYPTPEISS